MSKESLSLEETNKIRISLGLKPLPAPTDTPSLIEDTTPDADTLAESNYAHRRATETREKAAKDLQMRLDKARNRRELGSKLKGRGLGEVEVKDGGGGEGEMDSKAWVKQQKKRQKQLAAEALRKEKELAELEGPSYSEADLAGIKVAHEMDDFEGGEDVILTLKDSRILADEDDQLHNVNLTEATTSAAAVAQKKKGKQAGAYTGYDDDEFGPGATGERSVLKKYEDEKEKEGFMLGTSKVAKEGEDGDVVMDGEGFLRREERKAKAAEELKKGLLNGEYEKNFATDYLQEGDTGFKKPKKSKSKKSKHKTRDPSSFDPTAMDLDTVPIQSMPTSSETPTNDTALVDDEEIQSAMARMRREAGKMRVKRQVTARPIKTEEPEDGNAEEDGGVDNGLVMDDTSEFVRSMGREKERLEAEALSKAQKASTKRERSEPPLPPVASTSAPVYISQLEATVNDAEEDEEMEYAGAESPPPPLPTAGPSGGGAAENEDQSGTSKERYVNSGMASTLALLKQQGLIKPLTSEEREKERTYQEKQAWMAEQRRKEALRDLDRERARKTGGNKDQAQREYDNRQREAAAARESLESFKHYAPVVEIKYNDEFGRELNAKEAWKALSHKFHGKGSGKMKTEKRIRKIEEEKKLAAMASGDTPTGTNEAFRKRQEKLGSATMVLSVGNKGSAPQQEEFLSSSLSKPSKKGKGKEKDLSKSAGGSKNGATDLMSGLGAASLLPVSGGGNGNGTSTPMMAPRKAVGFKPIAAQGAVESEGGGGKKRKAEEEAEGSPFVKRTA